MEISLVRILATIFMVILQLCFATVVTGGHTIVIWGYRDIVRLVIT